jgi:cellobiose phosphorylase
MRYGYFNDTRREYVITRPDTPLPWINYLGSEAYFGLISNTAGGYSFYQDARLRRLTRYRYNNAPLDSEGRHIYLRDEDPHHPGPVYWSPTWQPTRTPLDAYECRHGMGYTVISSQKNGIESSIRYFVPLGETLEVWELTLTNHRDKPAKLSVFSAIEFNLWDAMDDATNFQRNYSIGQVEVAPLALKGRGAGGEGQTVIYHKTEYRERRDHFAYFACSEPLTGFDTQREAFLGPYRGWDSPRAVETGHMSGSEAHGWQPIGAQHVKSSWRRGKGKQSSLYWAITKIQLRKSSTLRIRRPSTSGR